MTEHFKVCVISGATSGVGLATARRFAKAGYRISICGRNTERLNSAKITLEDIAGTENVLAINADMSRTSDARRLINESIERFSRIDLLVNNAATAPLAMLEAMTDDAIDNCIDLNIRGVYYATQTAWTHMQRQGSGIVVNVSSQAAVDPFPGFSLYGSTKAWIELFTIALANEGRPHGIRSYCIRPGAIETPMLRGLFPDFPPEQCVSPEEIADAIWATCGPDLSNSSGQTIKVSRQ